MPSQSRAQRRRQNARQNARSSTSAARSTQPIAESTADQIEEAGESSTLSTGATMNLGVAGTTRPARQTRRPSIRPAPEPIDYSADYISARRDLVRIALWSALLFSAMIVIRLTGVI